MKKIRRLVAISLATTLLLTGCMQNKSPNSLVKEERKIEDSKSEALENDIKAKYLKSVDLQYSLNIANKLTGFKSNEKFGYRTAGSKAEVEAGEMLAEEFKKMGLQNVSKDEFTTDTWEFEKAELKYVSDNEEISIDLGGYATNFDTEGPKEFELVYAGEGTKEELERIDVKGKLVLLDINQRDNWWINYPAYEAWLHEAAGVIVAQNGGYAEIDEEALNTQDICGPEYAPAFSISRKDADKLISKLEASKGSDLKVTFDAKSVVERDGKAYNIVGEIPGKNPDSLILVSAHYDAYFDGFQDDATAIGLMMGIAKGFIDSGYNPNSTIVFVAQAAEEWGTIDSRYDWSVGAFNQIFKVRPEWAGKAIANINFELPSYEHNSVAEIRTAYEYHGFMEKLSENVPSVEGVYKDGIKVYSPLRTWSDDFSYSIAGVPATRNDFQDSEFMRTHYHSQFDNEETYNEKAFEFHHNLYGIMVMAFDNMAVAPLDFTRRFQAMKESIDSHVFNLAGAKEDDLVKSIDEVYEVAQKITERVNSINKEFIECKQNGDLKKSEEFLKEGKELNNKLLEIFKDAQDKFVRLTWEDEPIFPYERFQYNIESITKSIEALETGNVALALDEYLYLVDNNWYAYSFSEDTFMHFTNQVMEQPLERLNWGAGRVTSHENLYEVINSLLPKYEEKNPEVSKEIDLLKKSLENQNKILRETVDKQIEDINDIKSKLESLL